MRSGRYALVPAMKVSVTFSIDSGSPKMLLAGATLQLPSQEALARKHFGQALHAQEAEPALDHSQVRKHWVRYP